MKHILFYALFFILKIASAQAQSLDQPKNYPADAVAEASFSCNMKRIKYMYFIHVGKKSMK